MATPPPVELSRRERQILEILYRLGRASVAEVLQSLPDPPSYSAVRTHLRILERKGHIHHEQDGPRYVFEPTLPRDAARRLALRGVLRNFFQGSPEQVVATLLEMADQDLSDDELERIAELIDRARREGR